MHKLLERLDKGGKDLCCLVRNQSLDIWHNFCKPMLQEERLTGKTVKLYIHSLQMFLEFVRSNYFVKIQLHRRQKCCLKALLNTMPKYKRSIHRRTAVQNTERKLSDDQERQLAKKAIAFLKDVEENKTWDLDRNEFTLIRDYLIVTVLVENGSRPGPLETCQVSRFHQAQCDSEEKTYVILLDEHKTTHQLGRQSW